MEISSGGTGSAAEDGDDDNYGTSRINGYSISSLATPSISVPLTSPSSNSPSANPLQHIITEATEFSALIKRLRAELAAANKQIEEKNGELAEYKDKLDVQNSQLREASVIMQRQQIRIDHLEEKERQYLANGGADNALDLKELKTMAAKERQAKALAEEKLEKFKKSMHTVINGELNAVIEELTKGFGENSKASVGDRPNEKLEHLAEYVQNKFGTWTENQIKMKTELGNMQTMVQNLGQTLASGKFEVSGEALQFAEDDPQELEEKPRQLRQRSLEPPVLVMQQQQRTPQKLKMKSPSKIPNSDLLHGEDIKKQSRGFYCICGQEYSTKSNLRIHVRTFTEEGKFKCGICNQRFVLYYMLRRHKEDKHNIATPKGEIGCVDCGKVYSSYARLYEHRKMEHTRNSTNHSQNISSQFYEDDEEYDSDDIMIIESEDAEKAVFSPIKKYTNLALSSVAQSYSSMSPGVGPSSRFFPPVVPKVEVDDSSRKISYSGKRHGMNIAKRYLGFYCICGIQFISRKRLDGHVQFHNSNLPENVSINYAEKDSDEDEDGEDEYIDGQPAPDDGVEEDDDYTYEGNVTQDNSKKHGYHPTEPTTCICGYQTAIKYNLTKHIKYNTAERKFACESCPLRFVNYSILRRHYLRSHKDVAMWNMMKSGTGCSKCGKIFGDMLDFQQHRRTVHGVSSTVRFKRRVVIPLRTTTRRFAQPIRNAFGRFVSTKREAPPPPSSTGAGEPVAGPSNSHRLSPGQVKKFACPHCPATYATLHQLRRHKRGAHNIVMKGFAIGCVDCGISFSTRVEHTRHRIEVHHSAIGRKKFKLETDSQMPNLTPKTETSMRVSTPQTSPQPIPIPINQDEIDDDDSVSNEGQSSRNQEQPTHLRARAPTSNDEEVHQLDKHRKGKGCFCVCGAHFNEKKNLYSHIRRKTEQWNFQCKICLKPFFYHAFLKRHMLVTHKVKNIYSNDKTMGCAVCGATFGSLASLRQHVKVVHQGGTENPVVEEGEEVEEAPEDNPPAEANMEEPQQNHGVDVTKAGEGHYCLCGKNCNSERALIVHIQYQTRERKLQCPHCDKRFICASYLRQHTDRAHRKAGVGAMAVLYRCVKCRRAFKTNVDLYRHHKNVHKNDGAVNVGRGRRRNNQVHKPLRGNKCSCGKIYTCKSTLKRHLRIQAEGKVFRCDLCSKRFSERGGLNKHIRRIHRRSNQENVASRQYQ